MKKCLHVVLLLNILYFMACKTHERRKITRYIREDGDTLVLCSSVKSVQSINYKAFDSLGIIIKGKESSQEFDPIEETLTFDSVGEISKISETFSSEYTSESSFKNGKLIEIREYQDGNLIYLTLFKRVKGIVTEKKCIGIQLYSYLRNQH